MNTNPKRIQLKRTKGWRLPKNTMVVSRPSIWGNPFSVVDVIEHYEGDKRAAQADCVRSFEQLIDNVGSVEELGRNAYYYLKAKVIRKALRGKNLACWCKPGEPCHADVLLRIANEPNVPAQRPPANDV